MKKKLFFSLFVFIWTFQANGAGLQTLLGSDWARNNPGKLPYEKCYISTDGEKHEQFMPENSVSLIFLSYPSDDDRPDFRFNLTCTAPKIGVAYKIPLNFYFAEFTAGVFLEFITFDFIPEVKLSNLNGKSVADLMGDYTGIRVGGGIFIAGGSRTSMKNREAIQISVNEFNVGKIFSLERKRANLTFRNNVTMEECLDSHILLGGDTRELRNPENECTPNRPYGLGNPTTDVNVQGLGDLKFEKI